MHHDSIERFGGTHGLRDENAFEAAMTAENRNYYENAELTICAATYASHSTKACAFVDGNKRIGAAVSIIFLQLNNLEITASNPELIEFFLKIAASELTHEDGERFFAENVIINS